MVGDQAVIGIYNYYMIFKSGLKGYSDQVALPYKHQKFMDASVEAIDDDIVLKFKNLLIEEGGNYTIVDCLPTFIYEFLTLLVRDMAQIGGNLLLILARVEPPKFMIKIKSSGYFMASW